MDKGDLIRGLLQNNDEVDVIVSEYANVPASDRLEKILSTANQAFTPTLVNADPLAALKQSLTVICYRCIHLCFMREITT